MLRFAATAVNKASATLTTSPDRATKTSLQYLNGGRNILVTPRLERNLNDVRDLLGEIVSGPQVFSQETHLTIHLTIDDWLPGVIRDMDIQRHLGRAADGGYFALSLAAFSEGSRRGMQRDQVRCARRIFVTAAINVLKFSSLRYLRNQVFVNRHAKFRRHRYVAWIRGLNLNGRSRKLLHALRISRARLSRDRADQQKSACEYEEGSDRGCRSSVMFQRFCSLLFVRRCRFCEGNAGFRAQGNKLLFERSGLSLRKHKDCAVIAAIVVLEFHREDVDLM
jgi:hypothetical protein